MLMLYIKELSESKWLEVKVQLKDRLARQCVAHPNDSVAVDVNLMELKDIDAAEEQFSLDDDRQVIPDSGYTSFENQEVEGRGNTSHNGSDTMEGVEVEAGREVPEPKKLRVQFGHKYTHNEQIMVAPCGIILSQATFFGAEAVLTVIICCWYFLLVY